VKSETHRIMYGNVEHAQLSPISISFCLKVLIDYLAQKKPTSFSHSRLERVAPHGTRAERKSLQPSPRGCDGERV
jgi:hypothetical protein